MNTELATTQQIDLDFIGGKVSFTDTGIVIDNAMTFDQWKEGLRLFKWMTAKLTVGLADYIDWGKVRFGAACITEALEQMEFSLPDVKSAIAISSVPLAIRRPGLTSEHYSVLAKAPATANLTQWADTAVREELSPSQLKASIVAGEVVTPSVAKAQLHGLITFHGIRGQFDMLLNRLGGIAGVRKMDPEAIKEILGELAPIAELYQALLE